MVEMELRRADPGELGGPVTSGLELREMGASFKDVDEGRRQVLCEFPHESVDTYGTVFGENAFRDSFERRLPVMCWCHDLRDPIGHAVSYQITPRATELRGQFGDFSAVPNAKRAFSQIQDGTLTDFSFGFKGAHFEDAQIPGHRGVKRITKATMREFSPVTIGSIPGAVAVGVRSYQSWWDRTEEEAAKALLDLRLLERRRSA